jgi:uncharacterized Zn finger protein
MNSSLAPKDRISMPRCTEPTTRPVMTHCPECAGELAVLRIFAGRGGDEYWTLRCVKCGGIHLDIVKPSSEV